MRAAPKPLILIVEDEEYLAKLLASYLENAGMQVQVCHRGASARHYLRSNFANLMLLDLNLPDQTGFDLLEDLREDKQDVPTIFLTGNTLEISKLRGLAMGGDDYIIKPFSYAEVAARITAVLRRAETKADHKLTENVKVVDEGFDFAGTRVSPVCLEIKFCGGQVRKIGRKEMGILACFHNNHGVVLTRKMLIHAVWGLHADVSSRSLDQYIMKVRELFKEHGNLLDGLRTVHGVGYIYEPKIAAGEAAP